MVAFLVPAFPDEAPGGERAPDPLLPFPVSLNPTAKPALDRKVLLTPWPVRVRPCCPGGPLGRVLWLSWLPFAVRWGPQRSPCKVPQSTWGSGGGRALCSQRASLLCPATSSTLEVGMRMGCHHRHQGYVARMEQEAVDSIFPLSNEANKMV